MLFEHPVKILIVGKSHHFRNFQQLVLPLILQLHCPTDAVAVQKAMEGVPRFLFELGIQVGAGDIQLLAQVCQGDGLGIVLPDIGQHNGYIFVLRRGRLCLRQRFRNRRLGNLLLTDAQQAAFQFSNVHRLQKILHHPQMNGLTGIGKLTVAGKNHGGESALLPPQAEHFQTVHIRHPNIGNDDIRMKRPDLFQSLLPGSGLAGNGAVHLCPIDLIEKSSSDQIFILHQ